MYLLCYLSLFIEIADMYQHAKYICADSEYDQILLFSIF